MSFKKLLISGILSLAIFLGSTTMGYAQNINYTVRSGDTYWVISQKYGVPIKQLMQVNNANQNSILYAGQYSNTN